MNDPKLIKINNLIEKNDISLAQIELSKLGEEYFKNADYLYIRGKLSFENRLYYLSIDTLLIALEFNKNDSIFNLLSKVYKIIGNNDLSKKFLDPKLRIETAETLKNELTGIFRKKI
tara:strand:- start:339 stop:689 length:351 start_codon:yes stop_codon:yes gene_type:complete